MYIYIGTDQQKCTYIYTYTQTCTKKLIHTEINTHTHTHAHTHTHTHTVAPLHVDRTPNLREGSKSPICLGPWRGLQVHESPRGAGKDLGHEERLRKEALHLPEAFKLGGPGYRCSDSNHTCRSC